MIKNPSPKWEALLCARSPREREGLFIDYCKDLFAWKTSAHKTVRETAYFICSTIRFDDLNQNKKTSEIIDFACDIERFDGHLTYNMTEEEAFNTLKKMIEAL